MVEPQCGKEGEGVYIIYQIYCQHICFPIKEEEKSLKA